MSESGDYRRGGAARRPGSCGGGDRPAQKATRPPIRAPARGQKSNFKILDEFVTFEPVGYSVVVALLRIFGYRQSVFAEGIQNTYNAFSLQLLIKLAGDLQMESCIEPICGKITKGRGFHREIQRQEMLVTPFNDIAILALKNLPADKVLPIARAGLEYVRVHKRWHQRHALKRVIKFYERTIAQSVERS